jgi:hypothetical protein
VHKGYLPKLLAAKNKNFIFIINFFSRNYEDQTIRITQRACNQNNYVIYLSDTYNSTINKPAQKRDISNKHHKKRQRKNRKKHNKFGIYNRNPIKNRIELFRGEKFENLVSLK